MIAPRRTSRQVHVGSVPIGGDAPIAVQSMTKTHIRNTEATLSQIRELADLGCAIVRCAVPTVKDVAAFGAVVRESPVPLVADIHFDCRIALEAIAAGAHKIRINPGNMSDWGALERVATSARERSIPIRLGLNSGSVKHDDADDSRPTWQLLSETALAYASRFASFGFRDIVLSVKASSAAETLAANRDLAPRCDCPLHLGVTAAGPREEALLKSAIGVGALLAEGIGDTIRLSFTGPPGEEVTAAYDLLRAADRLADRPVLVSCPTCGRCSVDLRPLVAAARQRLQTLRVPIRVAIMGCEVNGPGEASDADVGLAAAGGRMVLFRNGKRERTVAVEEALDVLLQAVREIDEQRKADR